MYIPPSFRIDDPAKLSGFVDSYNFATLVSCHGNVPFATHLPVLRQGDDVGCKRLFAHMARTNPQWRHFSENVEVLTIFQGPHAYISPSWYATQPAVPTWNYAATHVYGIPKIIDDHDLTVSMLNQMVGFYEQSFERPWSGVIPDDYRDKLIQSIVAFEINVTRVEGKFKLGQNRSAEDLQGVFDALSKSKRPADRELATLMLSEKLAHDSPSEPEASAKDHP